MIGTSTESLASYIFRVQINATDWVQVRLLLRLTATGVTTHFVTTTSIGESLESLGFRAGVGAKIGDLQMSGEMRDWRFGAQG